MGMLILNVKGFNCSSEGFLKCRDITIAEHSGSDLYNYAVEINVTYDSDMNSDLSDIVFVNATCEDNLNNIGENLNYWVEKKEDSNYAWVWVNVSELKALDNTVIAMCYDKDEAISESNISKVAIEYEDCEDNNLSDWDIYSNFLRCQSKLVLSGDYSLNFSSTNYFKNNQKINTAIPENMRMVLKVQFPYENLGDDLELMVSDGTLGDYYCYEHFFDTSTSPSHFNIMGDSGLNAGYNWTKDTTYRIKWYGILNKDIEYQFVNFNTSVDVANDILNDVSISDIDRIMLNGDSGERMYLDDIAIFPCVGNYTKEPTYSIGGEFIIATTSTTTTTLWGDANVSYEGYVSVVIIDTIGKFENRLIFIFQNSSDVIRFIKTGNFSERIRLGNDIHYELIIEPKGYDLITSITNKKIINYAIEYFFYITLIVAIIIMIIYAYNRGKTKRV